VRHIRCTVDRFHRLRQAEVEHLDGAVWSELHIAWFQIAVDDPSLVGRFERMRDLLRNRECLVEWNRSLGYPVRERRPFNQFEDERREAVRFFDTVDGANIWVIQRRKRFCFALKASHALRVGDEQFRQDFERDLPIEPCIACAIYDSHSASADLGRHFVDAKARTGTEGQTVVDYTGWRRRGRCS